MKSAEEIIEIINEAVKREEKMCLVCSKLMESDTTRSGKMLAKRQSIECMDKIILLNSILREIQEN